MRDVGFEEFWFAVRAAKVFDIAGGSCDCAEREDISVYGALKEPLVLL